MTTGVVIDCDGVLYRGSKTIPGAKAAIKKLQKAKIPHVFLTNGGGMTEAQKAKEVSGKLGVSIREEQVILSHTPFRELAKQYAASRVLVLGHDGCLGIAKSYGFRDVVSPQQLHQSNPVIFPRKPMFKSAAPMVADIPTSPIAAAFVFHDPVDWGLDIQVLLDATFDSELCKQAIPVYACNADLYFNTDFAMPRLTQGAFLEAFRHLYELTTNSPLELFMCGKPFTLTSRLAESVLAKEAKMLGIDKHDVVTSPPPLVFAIGDNPRSDVRGARNAGWTSILVKSGVWTDNRSTNDPDDPADFVLESIVESVDLILEEVAKKRKE